MVLSVAFALMAGFIPIVTLTSCYLIALEADHIIPKDRIPQVTDLGDHMPEILIFSIGFCIASSIQMTLVLLRYVQIRTFNRAPLCPIMNTTGCVFGWLMVLGQMMLTSVRHSEAPLIHYIGKTIQFSASCVYITIQSYISVTMTHYHNRGLAYLRCLLAILTSISAIVLVTGIAVSKLNKLGFPQVAEMAHIFFNVIFWISLTADFHRNKIDLLRQGKTKIRIRHRSGPGGAESHRIINYLHSIMEDSSEDRKTRA